MATVSFLSPHPVRCRSPLHREHCRNKISGILCCKKDGLDQNSSVSLREDYCMKRRDIVFQAVASAFIFSSVTPVALAVESEVLEDFRVYYDDKNKFKIEIPMDWLVGNGEGDGVRSLTAFYPDETSSSNVSILITGLGADFTRLESFGKVDAFAENLVSGLDRSWQKPPGVAAKLIDSKAANGLYYIEYTLKNPGESRRHLLSVLGMANNGIYNRLYTITGQYKELKYKRYAAASSRIRRPKDEDEFYSAADSHQQLSRRSSVTTCFHSFPPPLNNMDSQYLIMARRRSTVLQELTHCHGWPFGICRKALLLPPLPKSPTHPWSWTKSKSIRRHLLT